MGESRSRRNFLRQAAALSACLSGGAVALQPGKPYVIGIFSAIGRTPPAPRPLSPDVAKLLARHGFIVGGNVRIEREYGDVPPEEFPDFDRSNARIRAAAQRLLARNPDVILCFGGARILKSLTRTTPIIFGNLNDVEGVLVKSLNRPGVNVTGVVIHYNELIEKRLELVRELLPRATKVGFVSDYAEIRRMQPDYPSRFRTAARRLGLELVDADTSAHGGDLDATLKHMLKSRPDAFLAAFAIFTAPDRERQWIEFQKSSRIPYIGDGSKAKGVVSYGADYDDHWRRAWELVVKMLKGARPEETPVDQDTRFILTADPKGAREIGIEIPASILIRANVLIQ